MYFNKQILNEGIIFWIKNVYNHFKNKENKEMTMEQAANKLRRNFYEFYNKTDHSKEQEYSEIMYKGLQSINHYNNLVDKYVKEEGLDDGPYAINFTDLNKKLHIEKYFADNYPTIFKLLKTPENLFGLMFFKEFAHDMFKKTLGAAMAVPVPIYVKNKSYIVFVTFDEDRTYNLFTITATKNGELGLDTCKLQDLTTTLRVL